MFPPTPPSLQPTKTACNRSVSDFALLYWQNQMIEFISCLFLATDRYCKGQDFPLEPIRDWTAWCILLCYQLPWNSPPPQTQAISSHLLQEYASMEEQTFKAALCRSLSVSAPHPLLLSQMSECREKSFQLLLDESNLLYSNTIMGCKKKEQLGNTNLLWQL